jgi:hypothetical protein
MTIKVGEKVRDTLTKEEGVVIAISDNTPNCVVVRFGSPFEYVIERERLEQVDGQISDQGSPGILKSQSVIAPRGARSRPCDRSRVLEAQTNAA